MIRNLDRAWWTVEDGDIRNIDLLVVSSRADSGNDGCQKSKVNEKHDVTSGLQNPPNSMSYEKNESLLSQREHPFNI